MVDETVRAEITSRWGRRLNRRTDSPDYRDVWFFEQCGGCTMWLALAGRLGADWGVCASQLSPFDGMARFEHDGCEHFVEDPEGFGVTRG